MNSLSPAQAGGERLSWESSGLPRSLLPDDSVEDGEKLSGYGDDSCDFGLALGYETIAERFEDWVVMAGNHCGHEESGAHRFAAAADRSEEHTSELQSHSFISYAVFCLKKKTRQQHTS